MGCNNISKSENEHKSELEINIDSFKIACFNPYDPKQSYFQIIYKESNFYLLKSKYKTYTEVLKIDSELEKSILLNISNIDKLIKPINPKITGDELVTDKVDLTIEVDGSRERVKYNIQTLKCFDGYSDDFYEFYLTVRSLVLKSEYKCSNYR